MIKKLLSVLILLLPLMAAGADNGMSILQRAVKAIDNAPSLSADFTLNESGNRVTGTILTSGQSFYIRANNGDYETWFDGKSQWTWNSATEEINLSQPTAQELNESNPLTILHNAPQQFDATIVSSDSAADVLRLTPKKKNASELREVEVKISRLTNFPVSMKVILKEGDVVDFSFTNIAVGEKLPSGRFSYDRSHHPGAEIIDLR